MIYLLVVLCAAVVAVAMGVVKLVAVIHRRPVPQPLPPIVAASPSNPPTEAKQEALERELSAMYEANRTLAGRLKEYEEGGALGDEIPAEPAYVEAAPYGRLPSLGYKHWEVVIVSNGTRIPAGTQIDLLDIDKFYPGCLVANSELGLTILSSNIELPVMDCQAAVVTKTMVSYPLDKENDGELARVSDGKVEVFVGNHRDPFQSDLKQFFDRGRDMSPMPVIENKNNNAGNFKIVWATGAEFTPPSGWTMKTTVRFLLVGSKMGDCLAIRSL